MVVVLAIMSVSTGGVIRLTKRLVENLGLKSGDRLVILKEDDKIIIQFQRGDKIIFRFGGEIGV